MVELKDFIQCGKIIKTHSLYGKLIWKHPLANNTLLNLEYIFIEKENKIFIPYFIEKLYAIDKETVHLIIEDIDTLDKAKHFLQKELFLPKEIYKNIFPQTHTVSYIEYEVFDNNNFIGKLIEVYEYHSQKTGELLFKKKKILIPLHDDFIIKVDKQKKQLFLKLPKGLLDIYL